MRGRSWWTRRRPEDIAEDIAEEINTHLAMATRERMERGMAPDEARAAALREFGNVALVQQTTREVWSWVRVEQFVQDIRFGARILRQAPGLSATAVILVALVIGGNTTIYSIVNGLLVSPATGVTAEGLVGIKHVEPGAPIADPFVSFPNFEDYARLTTTVERLAAWSGERLTLGTDSGNYAIFGALVTTNYFDTFGVSLTNGRGFRASDDEARDGLVVVISDRVWRERFAQSPDVVGRATRINGYPATVVGVASPGFAGALMTPGEDVWVPIIPYYRTIGSLQVLRDRTRPLVCMVGQPKASATLQSVRTEFTTLVTQLRAAFPNAFTTYTSRGVTAMTNPSVAVLRYSAAALLPVGDMAPSFLALFSIVTLLTLLVVSANVANLMLSRAVIQQRDTAVRQSLGASRLRIFRMLVAEGVTIAVIAWAGACVFAWWTSRAVLQLIEPRPGLTASIRPDWTMTAYAMLLAAVATLAFMLAPALRAWRQPVLPLLRSGEHGIARGRSRLSNGLVVLQLSFSVLLITSAGLAYRSVTLLDSGHVGFDADRLLLATVRAGESDAWGAAPQSDAQRRADLAKIEQIRQHLAEQPGIVAVTYSPVVPGPVWRGTRPVSVADSSPQQTYVRPVGPEYLRALGLQPIAGRDITTRDQRGAKRVALINRQLARHLFGEHSPIGQTVFLDERRDPFEVVGVAPDALVDGPVHDPQPRYMFIARQQSDGGIIDMTFYVRHSASLEATIESVGHGIAAIDPALPIASMATMRSRLDQVAGLERQITTLLVAFAIASLLVASFGQYAVAMFNMRRRTRDFGVRLALGASTRLIQGTVIRESFTLAIPGLLTGLALSAAVATMFRAQLFGVTPVDPVTYVGVCLLLTVTSVAASYLPAWRAGRVNVVETLRTE